MERLDPREDLHVIASPHPGLKLFLRRLAAVSPDRAAAPVLYVHGATFPSALSVAHRFDGTSWRDVLCAAGHDVWALDFLGFGESDRYPEMSQPAAATPPLCRAEDAAGQIAAAVRFIADATGAPRVSLVSHSWGAMPVCRFAGTFPSCVERIVLFAPITRRAGAAVATPAPAWRDVTLDDQWTRFGEDLPGGAAPVLLRRHFDIWGESYLDSDPQSRGRRPAAVRVPAGPSADNGCAWAGALAYDPALVEAPVAIIRGAWDHLVTDADAAWLFAALVRSENKRDVKIARGTHLMHLETMRPALWRETIGFLGGDDVAAEI